MVGRPLREALKDANTGLLWKGGTGCTDNAMIHVMQSFYNVLALCKKIPEHTPLPKLQRTDGISTW